MKRLFTLLLLVNLSMPLQAAWQLDNEQSWLYFISIKAEHIGEINTFKQLSGSVSDSGQVNLTIDLASVDTNIAIRDERMQQMLFNTSEFANATLTAQLDMEAVNGVAVGGMTALPIEATLDLHGEQQVLTSSVVVSRLAEDKVLVISQMPILVNAAQFKLVEGIEKLREIAGLPGISKVVPVTFTLTFVAQ